MIFWPKFWKISGKLKIKAKYLMRNFDEESNLHENDFLEFVLGKKFYSNFMMFLTNLDQKWIICGKNEIKKYKKIREIEPKFANFQ